MKAQAQQLTPPASSAGAAWGACTSSDEYVQLYLEHVLDVSVREQYSAFEDGFYRCVDKTTISLFRPEELQLLLLGKEEELDVSLLQKVKDARSLLPIHPPHFQRVCRHTAQPLRLRQAVHFARFQNQTW